MAHHLSSYPFFSPLLWLVLTLFGVPAMAATFAVTNLNDSSPGSLREAIFDANAAAGDDTIVFQSSLSGTITLTSGELTISSNITINGSGANVLAVSGNKASRIFRIDSGSTVVINGLTLKEGFAGTGGAGGAISSFGTALTITNSTLSGNSANFGGAIINVDGTLTVNNSILFGNSAKFSGGGILNFSLSNLTITNSTLSGNSAGTFGGGISNEGGTLTVSNSTLSGNSAIQYGGGIASYVTASYNRWTLGNSLVAGNSAPTGRDIQTSTATFTSLGHNLFGENGVSGVDGGPLDPSDIVPTVGIDAILAPLGDNGGPTQTHFLMPGSPAINAGDNALIPAGVTTDQRGYPRIQDGRVDIGAVEVGEAGATDIPTLSQWVLLLLGLLLAGSASLAQLRQARLLRR